MNTNELGGGWDEGETENHFKKSNEAPSQPTGKNDVREGALEILYRDPQIISSDIDVEFEGGILTLLGSVTSEDAKENAEKALINLSGVKEVRNKLRLTGLSSH